MGRDTGVPSDNILFVDLGGDYTGVSKSRFTVVRMIEKVYFYIIYYY